METWTRLCPLRLSGLLPRHCLIGYFPSDIGEGPALWRRPFLVWTRTWVPSNPAEVSAEFDLGIAICPGALEYGEIRTH